MQEINLLENPIKNYDWGSPVWIPQLLDRKPNGRPQAELWMGCHIQSPSKIKGRELNKMLSDRPSELLGNGEDELPFLFKVLAAAKPLSLQIHPNLEQAQRGWQRENLAGLPLDAATRNYRDANHKPEILCALGPFRAMAGFRAVDEILHILDTAKLPALQPTVQAMREASEAGALKIFLQNIFALNSAELLSQLDMGLERLSPSYADIAALIRHLQANYPGDIGLLAPMYLNILHLQAGQAIYLPAGILHSYVEGLGVELMANSDNVIRGGLTSKHIDVEELFSVIHWEHFSPILLDAKEEALYSFPTPSREFCLERAVLRPQRPLRLPARGARILLSVEGSVHIASKNENVALAKGQSAFVSALAGDIELSGSGTLFSARSGRPGA